MNLNLRFVTLAGSLRFVIEICHTCWKFDQLMRGAGMDTATVQHSTTPLPQDTTDRPITPVEFIVTFAEIRARSRLILQRPQQPRIARSRHEGPAPREERPLQRTVCIAKHAHRFPLSVRPNSPRRMERWAIQPVTAGVVSLGIKAFFPVARPIGAARALKRATKGRTIERIM